MVIFLLAIKVNSSNLTVNRNKFIFILIIYKYFIKIVIPTVKIVITLLHVLSV